MNKSESLGESAVNLHFLGTRGNIQARTAKHSNHSVLAIAYRGRRVVIDCGADLRVAPSAKLGGEGECAESLTIL
jgi:hypothetical protein